MTDVRKRCAVYTRKSTEEGLGQDFNSLDAQREACAAYVLSQKHEGWELVGTAYDDGGFSGGTMNRPALQQLLADIEAGRIDTIIVYKVDRLTRSLADFAKIVEILDGKAASFVSVTQAFNTTTSMGRLTLNVLLSFAQFEREVTGERIRDKIAASKQKGMWMGGLPPLGYDVVERKLVVNASEARSVRTIFTQYVETRSVAGLIARLQTHGITSKVRSYENGQTSGGRAMSRGALYALLKNRIYRGEATHKGRVYEGEHDAIIDQGLFDTAQAILMQNRHDRRLGRTAKAPSLLAGLVHDRHDRPMTASHAQKGVRRYRYYVTGSDVGAASPEPAQRIPARDLEAIVIARVRAFLDDANAIADAVEPEQLQGALAHAERRSRMLASGRPTEQREAVLDLIERVTIKSDGVAIALQSSTLSSRLKEPIILEAPATKVRAGKQTRMVIDAPDSGRLKVDPKLIRLVADANGIREALLAGETLKAIASRKGSSPQWVARQARIGWLAPDIITAILEGRQPPGLTRRALSLAANLPLDWEEQRRHLGFC